MYLREHQLSAASSTKGRLVSWLNQPEGLLEHITGYTQSFFEYNGSQDRKIETFVRKSLYRFCKVYSILAINSH